MSAGWVVQLDPTELGAARSVLDINSGPILIESAGLDWGDAAIQAYMADGRVGSLVTDFRMPNRTISIPMLVHDNELGQAAFNAARIALQQKVGLLQREGGTLKRETSTGAIVYADVMNATLGVPDKY